MLWMNITRNGVSMQTSNFPPKYVDTLRTTDLYEKDIRHRKSNYYVEGMPMGVKYLTGLTRSEMLRPSVISKASEIFPKNTNYLDYFHTDKSYARMVKIGASPDYLTQGCKVKFR